MGEWGGRVEAGLSKNHVFIAVFGLVLLTTNLYPSIRLATDSTGIIKLIVWNSTSTGETISDAYNMFVWIDFEDDYKGESFFPDDDEKKGWFPIFSKSVDNTERSKANSKDM